MDATTDEEYCTWMPASSSSALMAIVVIDLVLAGDNAIVIALAAREPAAAPAEARDRVGHGRRHGVRTRHDARRRVAAAGFPGLLAIGGALLVWIA